MSLYLKTGRYKHASMINQYQVNYNSDTLIFWYFEVDNNTGRIRHTRSYGYKLSFHILGGRGHFQSNPLNVANMAGKTSQQIHLRCVASLPSLA